MAQSIKTLFAKIDAEIVGNSHSLIIDAASIEKALPEEITFAGNEQNIRKLKNCNAGAVIVSRSLKDSFQPEEFNTTIVFVEDAQTSFIEILSILRPSRLRTERGVSFEAHIHPSAVIGDETNVYPGANVAESVSIGKRCDIHPGVRIGAGCSIGNNVTLHPNVVLYPDVVIGNHVCIHASTTIGADGFGYRLVNGRHQKIPHFGIVRIEDDVEIGANTTVDRAMIGETVIGEGTKLDNQVMIAHNCEIGKHNMFVSQVGLAGSVTSGDYVVLAGHVGIADHVHLGTGCTLGSKAGVHKNIPAGETWIGTPAQPMAIAMRNVMAQRKIPDMRKTMKQLVAQVEKLNEQILAIENQTESQDEPPTSQAAAA